MLFSRPPVRLSWTSSFRSIRKIPLPCTRFFSTSVPRYTVDMAPVDTSERLSKLRQLMQDHKVDVYSMTSYIPVDCFIFFFILFIQYKGCVPLLDQDHSFVILD